MGIFGLLSKKEVAEKEKQARERLLSEQKTSLSNLAKGSQIGFSISYFDVFDPRFDNFSVPVAVHGTLVYAIEDLESFTRLNKTQNANDDIFTEKLKGQITKYIKSVVTNAPVNNGIPILQMERKILEIGELAERQVSSRIEQLFGIKVRSLDINRIVVDKDSRGYRELKSVTSDFERENLMAQQQVSLSSFKLQNELSQDSIRRQHEMTFSGQEAMQQMQLEHQRETMRIQREEMQRAARLQTESNFLSAHQANLNADVSKTKNAFASPARGDVPPMPESFPQVQYMVGINGQQSGPYGWLQLQQLVRQGLLTQQTYVWKQGMTNWEYAGALQELTPLFTIAPQV